MGSYNPVDKNGNSAVINGVSGTFESVWVGKANETTSWYDAGSKINAAYGLNVYELDLARESELVSLSSRSVKFLGSAGAGAGLIMDAKGLYNYYHPTSKNIRDRVSPGKALANTVMAGVGIWGGPVGGAASLIYLGVDALFPDFWPGVVEYEKGLQQYNEQNHFPAH